MKKNIRGLINFFAIFLANITKTNLTQVGYYQKGIMKYGDDEVTGEKFVIENILKNKIKKERPIFFDVGSNVGNYSLSLKKHFPNSIIYSFEPNMRTYEKIIPEALDTDIKFNNIGLGSVSGFGTIYDHGNETGTEHASIYKDVITDIHHLTTVDEMSFKSDTLDNFCSVNKVSKIDFLKIDTEGSEFDVIKGGLRMLSDNNIDIIQFEFNEMNVISRIFLKDYYNLLSNNYDIYRIDSKSIIHIPIYNTENEIFKYQNFLAINKSIT